MSDQETQVSETNVIHSFRKKRSPEEPPKVDTQPVRLVGVSVDGNRMAGGGFELPAGPAAPEAQFLSLLSGSQPSQDGFILVMKARG